MSDKNRIPDHQFCPSDKDIWRKSGPRKSPPNTQNPLSEVFPTGQAGRGGETLAIIDVDEAAKKARRIPYRVMMPAGLPGSPMQLRFRNEWKGSDARNTAPAEGSPGQYQVSFVLGRVSSSPNQKEVASEEGDSFIFVSQAGNPPRTDVAILEVKHDSGAAGILFQGYVNRQGRLAKLFAPNVEAQNFFDAEVRANRAIQGFLSQLSVRFNAPVTVWKTHIIEAATSNQQIDVTTAFPDHRFESDTRLHSAEGFQVYASLYREALNSNSPVYRFLCFYKIIEGLRIRRNRMAVERRERGDSPSRQREFLPGDDVAAVDWLNELFEFKSEWGEMNLRSVFPTGILGEKFGKIVENVLKPLRIGIAHAVLETGETTLIAHELLHMKQVLRWLPLTNCIARRMLKNDYPSAFEGGRTTGS